MGLQWVFLVRNTLSKMVRFRALSTRLATKWAMADPQQSPSKRSWCRFAVARELEFDGFGQILIKIGTGPFGTAGAAPA